MRAAVPNRPGGGCRVADTGDSGSDCIVRED
jgi:hypothetical protein